MSNGNAIYVASEIPDITGASQIAAVLDIEQKKLKKIHIKEERCKSREDIRGYNLSECPPEELEVTKMDVAAVVNGNIYAAFLCHNNGEMIFFDESSLAPIKDRIKSEDTYINYTARIHPKGYKYIVVKDGFEVLAAILPVEVLSDQYIKDLREFYIRCDDQYKWQRATAREKEQDAQEVMDNNE